MSDSISASAPRSLQTYYRILSSGAEAFGQGEQLRPLLSPHLDGIIATLDLHYDGPDYLAKGGR